MDEKLEVLRELEDRLHDAIIEYERSESDQRDSGLYVRVSYVAKKLLEVIRV